MGSSFEDLEVWKKSSRFAVDIYRELKDSREYGLKDQLCRSAVSIPSNIAEGRERGSRAEFIRFLNIAKGSAAEARTQIYIAREITLISKEKSIEFIASLKAISKMLQALINSLKN